MIGVLHWRQEYADLENQAARGRVRAVVVFKRLFSGASRAFVAIFCGLYLAAFVPLGASAAPYAAMVMDARSGEVLYSENADSRLHPASLTKMMTLYIAFEAVRLGEISLDTMVTISANAAAEPPSKLGLRAGQRIQLRYLIRAAAVKSANDAATAIGEAIEGSEAAFARRMNRTARALGMTRTTFRNAHGLTESGHLSTARDMTILGRHVFYDYPQYYNIFSRRTTQAGVREVSNTNRRFLDAYEGADGIKTGYTRAAGFNLVASAERRRERIIAAVFGGASTADRNARMASLLDLGFERAPSRVALNRPSLPRYDEVPSSANVEVVVANADGSIDTNVAGRIVREVGAPARSLRPRPRGGYVSTEEPPADLLAAIQSDVSVAVASVSEEQISEEADSLAEATAAAAAEAVLASADDVESAETPTTETPAVNLALAGKPPRPRPDHIANTATETEDVEGLASAAIALAEAGPETAPGAEAEGAETLVASAASAPPANLPEEETPTAQRVEATDVPEVASEAIHEAEQTEVAEAETAEQNHSLNPLPNPEGIVLTAASSLAASAPQPVIRPEPEAPEIVTRLSTSNGRIAGVSLGRFPTRDQAERTLITVSLSDMSTFGTATRKIVQRSSGFEANFMGMTTEEATQACQRVNARGRECTVLGG